MADEGVGLRRSALLMTRSPTLVRCYALLRWLGPCIAQAYPAPVISEGVSGALHGLVVPQAFVPDTANDLGRNIPHLPL